MPVSGVRSLDIICFLPCGVVLQISVRVRHGVKGVGRLRKERRPNRLSRKEATFGFHRAKWRTLLWCSDQEARSAARQVADHRPITPPPSHLPPGVRAFAG